MEYVENIEGVREALTLFERKLNFECPLTTPEFERQRIIQEHVHKIVDEESLHLSARYAALTDRACEEYKKGIEKLYTSIDESEEEGRKVDWNEKMFRLTAMKEIHQVEMERLDKEFKAEAFYLDELVKIYNIQNYYTNADLHDRRQFRKYLMTLADEEGKSSGKKKFHYNING